MPVYIIATPLGNLQDLSPRALNTLQEAELILAEDTRKVGDLVAPHGIARQVQAKAVRCDSRAEQDLCKSEDFIKQLKSDINIALVSDAGSPAISDPGAAIVALAHKNGVRVIPVPGPSAVIAALSVSGFAGTEFTFAGYLPRTNSDRSKVIKQYKDNPSNLVFYETPQRILASMESLGAEWGAERQALVARELSKEYETLYRGSLQEIQQELVVADNNGELRGEMVLVLEGSSTTLSTAGAAAKEAQLSEADENVLKLLLEHLSPKMASGIAAKITAKSKKLFYEAAVKLSNKSNE